MAQIFDIQAPQRRPSTSQMIGQALGNVAQGAGNMYLQGKMQEMFNNKQEQKNLVNQERSAKAISSIFPKQFQSQMFEALRSIPISMHDQALKLGLDFVAGQTPQIESDIYGGGQGFNPSGQANVRPQTPIDETKNLAATQRVGMGAVPGMPGYPQGQGAAQPFLPLQQQYQPVMGMPNAIQAQPQLPQRVMPGGQIPPQPVVQPAAAGMPQERAGMIVPEAKAAPTLADLSDEEFRQSLKGRPASMQKQMIKDRKSEQESRRSERRTISAEKKAEIAERKDVREAEKEPKEYIKKINDEYNSTLKKRPIYKIMEKKAPELQKGSVLRKFISERFHIPAGHAFKPNEEVLEKLSQQLLRGITSDYKGRILQSEVENYTKSNPSLLNSPEGMQKLAKIAMALDEVAEKKYNLKNDIVKDYRKRKEPLPEDLESQIMEKAADFEEDAYRKVESIMDVPGIENSDMEMVSVINPDGIVGKMPRKVADEAVKTAGYRLR